MATETIPTFDIPRGIWRPYLDGLSKQYQGWCCDVEVLSMDMGDQPMVERERLWGLSCDKGTARDSVLIETGDPEVGLHEHWVRDAVALREANTLPGSEADIQIESRDGSVTIIRIRRRPELPGGAAPKSAGRQSGRRTASRPAAAGPRATGPGATGRARMPSRAPTPAGTNQLFWLIAGVGLAALLLSRMRGGRRGASRDGAPSRPRRSATSRS